MGADELQRVPVAGGQHTLVAPRFARGAERTQNVVGLVPFAGDHLVTQIGQQLFQNGHLISQFLGHALALGFVAVVQFVAEGGGFQVESDGHLVGVLLGLQFHQDIHKAHQGVGVAAVFCCQQLDAVKGAVDNAVAVQYKKFQGETSDVFRLMGRAARQFKNIIP